MLIHQTPMLVLVAWGFISAGYLSSLLLRLSNQYLNATTIQLLIVVSIACINTSGMLFHLLVKYSSRLDDSIIIARFLHFVYLCKIEQIYSSTLILSKISSPISQ